MGHDASGDRRVRRTRARLHEALGALVHEKPFDAIAVKEILARADVGRSTFYAHFADKDALLADGIRDVLRAGGRSAARGASGRADDVLGFGGPLFEHVARHRAGGGAAADADGQAAVHERLRGILVEQLTAELTAALARAPRPGGAATPPALLAEHVAATFLLVLRWWGAGDPAVPPARADEAFRTLVRPALAAVLGD